MTERIAMRYTVALQGFGEADRLALTRFFGLGARRAPEYAPADSLDNADFILADADAPGCLAAIVDKGRLRDTVLVASVAPPAGLRWLARPIAPAELLRELDALLELRLAPFDEPVASDWVMADTGPPEGSFDDSPGRDVLVVDDSRIALKFLQVRLQGLGYRVHLAQTSDDALRLLARQAFTLVFLDVVLGPTDPLDGLGLCQTIKQRKSHPGDLAPKVVLVTGQASSSDRVRGDLAGCDAYLTKPLLEPAFLEALRLLDPRPA